MDMKIDLFKIVGTLITSIGGISVIFTAVVAFCSDIIAKKLEERYSLKLNKGLENYKASLGNKTYISKTKFDTEFEIYRSLSKNFFNLVSCINTLIPAGFVFRPADKEELKHFEEQAYKDAKEAMAKTQDELYGNAAFISQDIFDDYNEILKLCRSQLFDYEQRFVVTIPEKLKYLKAENYTRSSKILDKNTEITNKVRTYLSSLDVLE